MRRVHFRKGSAFVAALMSCLLATTAQKAQVNTKNHDTGQLTNNRDKPKEDQVAKLFDDLRANAKIPHLKRIGHRASLEQQVCTISLTDTPPSRASGNTFGFYKTANPSSVTPDLSKVTLFNDLHPKDNPSYARYSVAVWRGKDSPTGEATYWVGVQLFWSAGMEFFDSHFTDDIYYHNEWKKSIAAQCRDK